MPTQLKSVIFPVVLDSGKHTLSNTLGVIKASIVNIIQWPIFTKYYEDDFGSRANEVLEEPSDQILITLIREFVIEAINKWEPRIILTTSDIYVARYNPEKIQVELTYTIKDLNIQDSIITYL